MVDYGYERTNEANPTKGLQNQCSALCSAV